MLSTPQEGWTCITLNASGEIDRLGEILRAAWDFQKAIRTRKPETPEAEAAGADGNGSVVETETAGATKKPTSEEARLAGKFGWEAGDVEVTEESSSA